MPETNGTERTYGDLVFLEQDGTLTLTKYRGSDAAVKIEASYDGLPVTAIGKAAFFSNRTHDVCLERNKRQDPGRV